MSLRSTTSLSPVSAGELALLPAPEIQKAVTLEPIRFSGSDYLAGGIGFTMDALCRAFMLPKEIIEWSIAVDEYFIRARVIGVPRERAQSILDDETRAASGSLTTTSLQALSIAKSRVEDEAFSIRDDRWDQVWSET